MESSTKVNLGKRSRGNDEYFSPKEEDFLMYNPIFEVDLTKSYSHHMKKLKLLVEASVKKLQWAYEIEMGEGNKSAAKEEVLELVLRVLNEKEKEKEEPSWEDKEVIWEKQRPSLTDRPGSSSENAIMISPDHEPSL